MYHKGPGCFQNRLHGLSDQSSHYIFLSGLSKKVGSLQIGFPMKKDYHLHLGQRLSLFELFSTLEPLSLLAPGLFCGLVFSRNFISPFRSFCMRCTGLVRFSFPLEFFIPSFGWRWLNFIFLRWWLSDFVWMERTFPSLFLHLFYVLGPLFGHSLILSH